MGPDDRVPHRLSSFVDEAVGPVEPMVVVVPFAHSHQQKERNDDDDEGIEA